jgi:hypothetical protein
VPPLEITGRRISLITLPTKEVAKKNIYARGQNARAALLHKIPHDAAPDHAVALLINGGTYPRTRRAPTRTRVVVAADHPDRACATKTKPVLPEWVLEGFIERYWPIGSALAYRQR